MVEISPCHGYSTNYILAALTHNQKGALHSYEIIEEVMGKPIVDTIYDNQLDWLETDRLTVHVGDATMADIPSPDFLFLDSAHEAWFASWYFTDLVPRAKLCMVHDIVIEQPSYGTLVPKGPFMGIRESVHVLRTLALNGIQAIAAADVHRLHGDTISGLVTTRNVGAPERSVVFCGHEQSQAAALCHAAVLTARMPASRSKWRPEYHQRSQRFCDDPQLPWYALVVVVGVFMGAGYRIEALRSEFPEFYRALDGHMEQELRTVADLVSVLEVGTQLGATDLVSRAISVASRSLPSPVVQFYSRLFSLR